MVADVPVSMFLSAALDSAMITAMATQHGERPHTLTLAFAEYTGTPNDEAPMAEQLAAKLGTCHTTLLVRKEDFEEHRERLLAAMDQPTIDGVNTWFVVRAAASQGIKVALSGLGGDELFASYPSFADLPRIVRLARPFSRIPGLGRRLREIAMPLVSRHASPKYAGLLEYGGTLGGAYLLRRGLYMPWELPRLLDPDIAQLGLRDLQTDDRLNRTALSSRLKAHSSRLQISSLEMSWYMRHQLLRDTDWASMAQSLEVRVPFLDLPLLQAIAPWFAAQPGITKSEIAGVISQQIPPALLKKPKTGFSIPVREWLLNDRPALKERGMRGWARYIYNKMDVGHA